MAKWGLTTTALEAETLPWGLPRELLAPAKTQTDPVHQDIYWNELEKRIIDSRAMQRLRTVKQLGMTLKVYPSAEHSRFTHGLGTLRSAQDILDRIEANRSGPHAVPSLLDEWERDGDLELRMAEATILARLAALVHDITHVPFGHTIEDDLEVLTSHDKNEARFRKIWSLLPRDVTEAIEAAETQSPLAGRERRLMLELQAIVLDKVERPEDWTSRYPFVGDVVNNTICADLLDYLRRDHLFTGLPLALGDRFMDNFFVAPASVNSEFAEHLILRITRKGESRVDTISEMLKYLRYRYEITERALYHKTKLAYDAMLGKLLEMWRDALRLEAAERQYPALRREVGRRHDEFVRGWIGRRYRADCGRRNGELDAIVSEQLEELFMSFGDEGLLEHLCYELSQRPDLDERLQGVLELAERLRFREHFPMIAHAGGPEVSPSAEDKHKQFGSAERRRDLERRAAKWAGIDPAWHIVLWVPGPKMRLKLAEVLIEDRGMISTLAKHNADARQIAVRHEELWTVRVYGGPGVQADTDKLHRVVSFLRDEMSLPFRYDDGRPAVSSITLAAEEAGRVHGLNRAQEVRLERALEQRAAKNEATFEDLVTAARLLAEELE